jgi:hypothetical protein
VLPSLHISVVVVSHGGGPPSGVVPPLLPPKAPGVQTTGAGESMTDASTGTTPELLEETPPELLPELPPELLPELLPEPLPELLPEPPPELLPDSEPPSLLAPPVNLPPQAKTRAGVTMRIKAKLREPMAPAG